MNEPTINRDELLEFLCEQEEAVARNYEIWKSRNEAEQMEFCSGVLTMIQIIREWVDENQNV